MWCPTCEDNVTGHEAICTICGDTLVDAPSSSLNGETSYASPTRASETRSPETRSQARRQMDLMARQMIRIAQTQQMENNDQSLMTDTELNNEFWEEAPVEALNPQTSTEHSRPTSKECLDRIPRITIDERSSILHEASVDILMESNSEEKLENKLLALSFDAMTGELGAIPPYDISCSEGIVIAEPAYGGGNNKEANKYQHYKNRVVFVQRGGGLTFREKAEWAQSVGAKALLVGNNVAVWPYVMKDSARKSKGDDNLHIPVLMLKRNEGQTLQQIVSNSDPNAFKCAIKVVPVRGLSTLDSSGTRHQSKKASYECTCVVCRDGFERGDVVLRLPFCSHVFHETCALSWLAKHNTCPVCRRELPTDDIEYETERRRIARTHGGSTLPSMGDNPNNGWETMLFG